MTDGPPNHAYKVGHAAGRAAGIRAAMAAIASLPTGKSEDVAEGQEQAYRAIEDLLLSLSDGPPALPAVTPAPTLAEALELPDIKALVEAAQDVIRVWKGDGEICVNEQDLRNLSGALRRIAEGGE